MQVHPLPAGPNQSNRRNQDVVGDATPTNVRFGRREEILKRGEEHNRPASSAGSTTIWARRQIKPEVNGDGTVAPKKDRYAPSHPAQAGCPNSRIIAEVDGRIDGSWKTLHRDDSTMTREELRSPNLWLSRVALRSSPETYALDAAFVLINGTKTPVTSTALGPRLARPRARY